MWQDLTLRQLLECAKDPYPSIKKWAAQNGKRVVGSTIADVPEEVIYAYDILPVTILGTNKPLKKAPSVLPDNACSLARSNLELVLSYEGDVFDGFILPQVCDTTQHLSDIWRINFPEKYFESYLAPRQIDRPSAQYWVKEEIRHIVESLSAWTGKHITDEDLRRSIAIHNRNKMLLRELYELKKNFSGSIKNSEFFAMLKLSQQVDKAELNISLEKIKTALIPKAQQGYRNTILVGITCDPPEIYDLFDELKLNIVNDTLVTGKRYLHGIVPDDSTDPIDALARRHFERGFYSPIHDDVHKNSEEIKKLYHETHAKAVIYVHIEFCESQEFDLPDLKKIMKKEMIPMHVLDTEYQTTSLSHVRTRLQAFVESLDGGDST